MYPKVITISGLPGCGKSTAGKLLAEKLNYDFSDGGQAYRKLAEKHHMTLHEFNNYCDTHPEIDLEIEQWLTEQCQNAKHLVLQSWLAGWMCHLNNIPAFKIWLHLDDEEISKRIAQRENINLEEAKNDLVFRQQSVIKRYKAEYNIDYTDTSIYDYQLETVNSPEEVVNEIINNLPKTQ